MFFQQKCVLALQMCQGGNGLAQLLHEHQFFRVVQKQQHGPRPAGQDGGEGVIVGRRFQHAQQRGQRRPQPPDREARLESRAPLIVTFPKSMDNALAERLIWVTDDLGRKLAGRVDVTEKETVWQFTPEKAWEAGTYQLVADTRLEDLAGNSIARPFELDVFHPVQREIKAETVKVPFEVKLRKQD